MLVAPLLAMVLICLRIELFGVDRWLFAQFASGFLLWTFSEYAIHRYLHVSKNAGHFRHHVYPLQDNGPSSLHAFGVFSLFFFAKWICFGLSIALAGHAGMLTGYTLYLFVHNGVHRTKYFPKSKLRKIHEDHHKGKNKLFGVITTLWDRLLP